MLRILVYKLILPTYEALSRLNLEVILKNKYKMQIFALFVLIFVVVGIYEASEQTTIVQPIETTASITVDTDSSANSNYNIQCSRIDSRMVRNYIQKNIHPYVGKSLEYMSPSCPLHPSLDRYEEQEKNKQRFDRKEWHCKYCGKKFVSEFYIDRHMDNKHEFELKENASTCLADYCNIFGCPLEARKLNSHTDENWDRQSKSYNS